MAEIKRAMVSHEAVRDIALAVGAHDCRDPDLVGFVTPKQGSEANGAVRTHLQALLPIYIVPEHAADGVFVPESEVKKIVRIMIPVVVGVSVNRVPANLCFAGVGGDPTTAMQAMALCRQRGVSLQVPDVLSSADIPAAAARATRLGGKAEAAAAGCGHELEEELAAFPLPPIQMFHLAWSRSERIITTGALIQVGEDIFPFMVTHRLVIDPVSRCTLLRDTDQPIDGTAPSPKRRQSGHISHGSAVCTSTRLDTGAAAALKLPFAAPGSNLGYRDTAASSTPIRAAEKTLSAGLPDLLPAVAARAFAAVFPDWEPPPFHTETHGRYHPLDAVVTAHCGLAHGDRASGARACRPRRLGQRVFKTKDARREVPGPACLISRPRCCGAAET
ncbi:hypothetical protein MAPG_03456 [Magnaporthiopsis poae ATCC 64411]|uniref:Uncharacterized protein n=1 Tax=Magnaporthiopsis poae (strain ATCC 64411 / 73-15) TaxID=644358 RepID=A0A0C4DU22_MAGP6|nr:hypothetical protein MAPG_03456 [Magnaporthiopsis poae ATCC 64411]